MKALLHWMIGKVAPPDVTKIPRMEASAVATSVLLNGPCSVERDAWRKFYAASWITDDRRMRAVRGALWQREGRLL